MNFAPKSVRELYRERAWLIAFVAALYPAVRASNDPYDDRSVVYVETPAGQLSWHVDGADVVLFPHVPLVTGDDPRAQWDLHSTGEKYRRLAALTTIAAGPARLISFGYLLGHAPVADRVIDVRDALRDVAGNILTLDGRDRRVQGVVLASPDAAALINDLVAYVEDSPVDRPRTVAIGCADGRRKSVALTELVAEILRESDVPVEVEHWHVDHAQGAGPAGGES